MKWIVAVSTIVIVGATTQASNCNSAGIVDSVTSEAIDSLIWPVDYPVIIWTPEIDTIHVQIIVEDGQIKEVLHGPFQPCKTDTVRMRQLIDTTWVPVDDRVDTTIAVEWRKIEDIDSIKWNSSEDYR